MRHDVSQNLNYLTLHRSAFRHSYFTDKLRSPIFFEHSIDCWIVTNPQEAELFLKHEKLRPIPYAAAYEELGAKFGYSFENLIFAFKHLPLCQHGSDHRDSRRRLAGHLAARREHLSAIIPALVDQWMGKLEQDGEIELIDEVLDPLVVDVMAHLSQTDISDRKSFKRVSVIFDKFMGLRKRLELEGDIADVRAMIRRNLGATASEEDEGQRLALFVLGRDTLVGTLGESLYQIFQTHRGLRMSEIVYPPTPPETGVPYIERAVEEPFEYAGHSFQRGERIRMLMQGFVYSNVASDGTRMFGAGAHTCLGLQVSLEVWRAVVRKLSRITRFFDIVSYEIRADDYVFTCPKRLLIRMTA